ncbi:helix-turn-helix domain-containing protein [Lachnospiraceae bacterium 48-42]|jgi:transcriptional regulator with XRE-family HTH domain|nr:helix-turn-helix domain-containing protein [uncultured Schaedlerella sp.]MCI9420875.1 helix-turn-helix transcriptional regulator [Eubacterium sp.]NBI63527.1 XRE family transcriptional regulator [Clostridiales bacterium]
MPNLGEMIKAKREAAGLSQKKLGTACGLSDSEIMKIENGQRKSPNWKNLCSIAQALNFHPFEILLAAGYITEKDINPCVNLCGLEKLDEKEMDTLQVFIDFLISRKDAKGISEGGL